MSDLRTWLEGLTEADLLRVPSPVELDHTGTALVVEMEKQGRTPVVLFERPAGHDVPVLMNLFADRRRIAAMAGASPEAGGFNARWQEALKTPVKPRMVESGAVQDVVLTGDDADATQLPICRHFAADAGRYIGSGILICKDPDTGVRNLSYQRLQLKGPRRFGASLHSRGHIWEHLERAGKRGKNLPVAVVIGCHPAIYLAAGAKVAMDVDELDIAGSLLNKPVDLVRCKTIDCEVPADAEYVIEGEILADALEDEGPFGEYTGYSTSRSTRNVFVVSAITHKSKPIWLDLTPGYSAEHLLLGRVAKEAHVFTRLKEVVPNLAALNYPKSGTHFHAYLSLNKSAEGQARHALMTLMGLDNYVKFAVAVDSDVDVFDEQEVLWALATRFQADRDLFVVPSVICNRLDPSSIEGMSAKMGLDATKPLTWDADRIAVPEKAAAWARSFLAGVKPF
jgi:2,5-furandicarboxylate decarboxylase 1